MKVPPKKSRGILSDIKCFFLNKPDVPTLIKFANEEGNKAYSHRIIQRIGIDVFKYSVQNIHRIGIKTPVRYVFEELIQWDGDSSCWPNYIATVERLSGGYPIGIYAMYARSSIAIQKEIEQTQLFFAVGFNFYGRESGKRITIINKIWEKVHNRVTANILNRFKQLCEWRFERIQNGK